MPMHALISFRLRFSRALLVAGLVFGSFGSAHASEIVVKTDSLPPSSSQRLVGFGSAVSRMATRLESPVDGVIVGVQVLWASPNGDAAPSLQPAIRISPAVPHPFQPVSTWATINAPTLEDIGVNEFRFLDPGTNLVPLAVPVSAGEKFFVDLEIFPSTADGPSVPGLLMDADGTQGVNTGLINGGWFSFTLNLPGGGDLGLRAIIQPVPEPSTYALAAISAVALLAVRRRKFAA